MKTLYVFMDESGDLQFTAKGKQHFILSAIYTETPGVSAAAMQKLKYEQLARGSSDLEFHATENSAGTRKRVAETIRGLPNIRAHTIWIDKSYTHPSLQDEVSLLALFGKAMGRWIKAAVAKDHDQIVMMFDSVLTGKKQDAFKGAIKPALKQLEIPFRVHFHPVKQDLNGQIADYFSWSAFRHLERNDPHPITALSGIPWTTFNLFQSGKIKYWEK